MFKSLPNAYQKAGFEKIKPLTYSDKEILNELKNLAKETGGMPSFYEIAAASKAGRCPSPGTITRRLGNLSDLKSRFDSFH